MKASTVLKKALKLFGNKGERWIKDTYVVEPGNYHEGKIYPKGAFCSLGAIQYLEENGFIQSDKEWEVEEVLVKAISPKRSVVYFNDKKTTTFPMIRKMFKKAIALAKAEGR